MTLRKIEFFDGYNSEVTPSSEVPTGPSGDISWQGAWISQNYLVNEAVEYNGSSYVCILNTISNEIPTNITYWDLIASKGDQGITGDTGTTGSNGADGIDGASIFSGSGVPSGVLGNDGDKYVDEDNGDFYSKASGSWSIVGSLKGATGDTGATGPVGVYNTTTVVSTDITLANNIIYLVDTSSGARSLTLPSPSLGVHIQLKDTAGQANTNNITIVRAGSENIEGVASSKLLTSNWGAWEFISDGTDWFMV